jgi:hypothetical protein
MALNDVTFIKGQGGLGRPLASKDHVSGLVAYLTNANLPAGFLTTDRIKTVYSLADAEALGFAAGSATNGVLHYHIKEYFIMQPQGELHIGLFDSTSIDYSKIKDVQVYANGEIRQIGVFDITTYASSTTTTLQAAVDQLEVDHMGLHVIYCGNISAVTDLSTLADLRALNNNNVSVVIGQDGTGVGAGLYTSTTKSVSCLGALLGTISLSSVHENIGHVRRFNILKSTEYEVPAMANGTKVNTLATSLLSALQDKGYIFIKKHLGRSGTYFNDSPTCISATSDYAYIENNRVIEKAERNIRFFLLDNLNAPLTVDSDGKLSESTIAVFKNDAIRGLESMQRDEEISAFDVLINPNQNVLSTSKIILTVKIVPRGVARQIEVNIGFSLNI